MFASRLFSELEIMWITGKTDHPRCAILSSIPDVTKIWRWNIFLMSFCREFAAILCLTIKSQEQSENITDSHTVVCLLSFILPLRKCPILQAAEASAVPAPQRRTTFWGNKRWDGVIREMPVNCCQAFQLTPSSYKSQSGLFLTIEKCITHWTSAKSNRS